MRLICFLELDYRKIDNATNAILYISRVSFIKNYSIISGKYTGVQLNAHFFYERSIEVDDAIIFKALDYRALSCGKSKSFNPLIFALTNIK